MLNRLRQCLSEGRNPGKPAPENRPLGEHVLYGNPDGACITTVPDGRSEQRPADRRVPPSFFCGSSFRHRQAPSPKRFFASFFLKERRPPPGFLLKNRQSVPPCYGHVQTAGLPYSYSVVHMGGQRHGIPPGSTAPLLRIFPPLQTGPFTEKFSACFLRRKRILLGPYASAVLPDAGMLIS